MFSIFFHDQIMVCSFHGAEMLLIGQKRNSRQWHKNLYYHIDFDWNVKGWVHIEDNILLHSLRWLEIAWQWLNEVHKMSLIRKRFLMYRIVSYRMWIFHTCMNLELSIKYARQISLACCVVDGKSFEVSIYHALRVYW